MLLQDKVIAITGAARGIGQVLALGLAEQGARVAVLDILDTEETMAKLSDLGPGGHIAQKVDVTDFATLKAAADAIVAQCGAVHGLVNNAGLYAGIGKHGFEDLPEADWDRMMAINVKGVWNATRAITPQMRSQKYGKIVNISSTTMLVGAPFMLHYVASKGAVFAMTRSMARELGADGIRVNTVMPGLTTSQASLDNIGPGMAAVEQRVSAITALGRLQQPGDLVGTIAYLVSPLSDAMTGQALNVDGGGVHW